MRNVHRTIEVDPNLCEQAADEVDGIVVVLVHGVRFDERVETHDVELECGDGVAQHLLQGADLGRAINHLGKLQPLWRGEEQPASKFVRLDPVLEHRGVDTPPEFIPIVLE